MPRLATAAAVEYPLEARGMGKLEGDAARIEKLRDPLSQAFEEEDTLIISEPRRSPGEEIIAADSPDTSGLIAE